ncbi:amino acid transporter, putative [Entamoeba invadens IP1]|uniref:amino acid transporter, putative n=1 Tax=Entamoeba invadens IP1 TaxID=370355 RepID=UPI0002C3D959|nr:amino acid transporter, putative [Entamoeba invadens IP1]ELP90661.1 amino acid transporter, putative [Entamoeba invadens IP1]|eukprot:XP_004257432.1 amino acid transporter, putative [Entamoeba invadens IP1]
MGETSETIHPKRALGVVSLLSMMYVSCVGGAYGTEQIISSVGPLIGIIMLYFLPFFVQFPMCLFTAEISLSLPSNAGYITWFASGFGEFSHFITPFITLLSLISTCLDCAVYPTLFVSYLLQKATIAIPYQYLIKLFLIVLSALINFIGIRSVGIVSIVIITMMLVPFTLFFFTAIPQIDWNAVSTYLPFEHANLPMFFSVVFWNLNGVENAANVVEEVKNPKRTIPLSLFFLVVLTSLTTATPLMAAVGIDQRWPIWKEGSFIYVSELLEAGVWGKIVSWMLFVGALMTSSGLLLNGMCFTARRFQGIANLNVSESLKTWFGRNNAYFGTPDTCILLTTFITMIFVFTTTFSQMVGVSSALSAFFLIGDFITFFELRRRYPNLERPFYAGPTWLLAFICAPSFLFCVLTLYFGIATDLITVIVALSLILGSFVLALIFALLVKKPLEPHPYVAHYGEKDYKPILDESSSSTEESEEAKEPVNDEENNTGSEIVVRDVVYSEEQNAQHQQSETNDAEKVNEDNKDK